MGLSHLRGAARRKGIFSDMEETTTIAVETSVEYVGRWNRLISTTNWEKGRIIAQWREALLASGASPAEATDEAWSRQVRGVTPQHVGRLRRVYERFGGVYEEYSGLYWSHFHAALDWPDAEMYLEGAVQNRWSVSQMRDQRWEAMGGRPEEKPSDADVVASEIDEDAAVADIQHPPAAISETYAEVHGTERVESSRDSDDSDFVPWDADGSASSELPVAAAAAPAPVRPFAALPPLPDDVKEAFELFKLAILAHKVTGWQEIARDDVLSVLESLRQLALAPAE
jgi:hypothetical protein